MVFVKILYITLFATIIFQVLLIDYILGYSAGFYEEFKVIPFLRENFYPTRTPHGYFIISSLLFDIFLIYVFKKAFGKKSCISKKEIEDSLVLD